MANLEKSNPKLLVVFSGGNAVGKSTISRKIEAELGGLVIENDAVKRQLLHLMPQLKDNRSQLNKLTWQYTMDLYPRLEKYTSNGLIVRDGVIDWYYDRILPIFQKAGYDLFIIGFDISRDKAIKLIKARGDTPTVKEERFHVLLEDHAIHTKRFRTVYTPDILLNDENIFDHQMIIKKLRERLRTLSSPN